MKISLIIPVINEAERIAVSISKALASAPSEIIVVDGGSTDGTLEIIQRTGVTVVSSELGRGVQLNRGAQFATGDVLVFLHADDWLINDFCQQIRQLSERRLSGKCQNPTWFWGGFRQRIESPGFCFRLLERGNALRVRWRGLVYGDQALFISRPLMDQIGGYPCQPLMEDYEISTQLKRFCSPILLDGPVHVSARRWLQRGVVRQTLFNWSLVFRYRMGQSPERLAQLYRRHDQ